MSYWIPILVRAEHVEQVTRLVLQLESEFAPTQNDDRPLAEPITIEFGEVSTSKIPAGETVWSKGDLSRLAMGTTTTTQRWTRAMDVCAEVPGTFLTTSEVAERSGMTIAEWRDAPRKITRHLKAHFADVPRNGDNEIIWPLKAKTRPEDTSQVSWMMDPETALLWKEIRS